MKTVDQKSTFVAKVESLNQGAHFSNTTVILEDKSHVNIKLEANEINLLTVGQIYEFSVIGVKKDEDVILKSTGFEKLEVRYPKKDWASFYSVFYQYAPLSMKVIKSAIELYIDKIDNEILKAVTKSVYEQYQDDFYLHPAATKFHHAYIGGLSYHTLTMLNMIDPMIKVYPYLNKDLLYAGTLLHDIAKIDEISGVDGEYTKAGLLLGHLVMGTLNIDMHARNLGYEATEEVLLLKHMVISHHGQLNFGSPKKPQIGEALLLWYLDSIDSKLTVLGEELGKTKEGEFTQPIAVLDKSRFYKTKK